jgi:hypothetical protein
VTWWRRQPRGLRRGEELLVEVSCSILDSTGTSLPDAGHPVIIGVSDDRILVWEVARMSIHAGKLLGQVSRSRLLHSAIERAGIWTRVRLDFEEDARVVVQARRERHPEQLAWALSTNSRRVEQ